MSTLDWQDRIQEAETLFDGKRIDEADNLARSVLQALPHNGQALQVVALVASERGQIEVAMEHFRRALASRPDLVPSHNGLGRCCYLLSDLDGSLDHFETALRLQPDHAFARFNRAMVLLKRGQFREGWLEYEWRWKTGMVARPDVPRPRWDGSPLCGRSIMIHTEQGLGDVIQFIRLLPHLKRQGRVVLACQKALHTLFRGLACVDEWFPIDEPGAITFDVYCPLMSLPGLLNIDGTSIPSKVPYISPDEQRVRKWKQRLSDLPGFKVGVAWQGSPTHKNDQFRSIALSQFAPLGRVPGVTLVSLQKGAGIDQIDGNRAEVPLHVFPDFEDEADVADTAAIIEQLDLVVSIDSAVGHLAGALGKTVWLLLGSSCDWRWQTERTDSPWYPTMRLFRQKSIGKWTEVFQEVTEALTKAAR